MAENFISTLDAEVGLSEQEKLVLKSVGVRNYEDLHALVQAFPSIVQLDIGLPKLSNAAFTRVSEGFATFSEKAEEERENVSFGALPPVETPITPGAIVGMPGPIRKMVAFGPEQQAIDLRIPNWPVRNQDQRGTCVSFGTVACVEHALATSGQPNDMSEQFLYWVMKTATADPYPNDDGSWLEYSKAALGAKGVCKESEWPYVGNVVNPVSGAVAGKPSAAAIASATANVRQAAMQERNPKQTARKVLASLGNGRPVAICLPVFSDALAQNRQTNWTTSVGWAFGHVLNPPPTSKVTGGHCVCIVGFSPDPQEPAGGHFIIRNSWSEDWGSANPDPESHAPAPGYGFVSATYLNTYTWEIMQL